MSLYLSTTFAIQVSSSQSEPINGDNKRKQGLVAGVNGTFFSTEERAQQYCLVTIFGSPNYFTY